MRTLSTLDALTSNTNVPSSAPLLLNLQSVGDTKIRKKLGVTTKLRTQYI